jgi:Fe-S-cluster containining protein
MNIITQEGFDYQFDSSACEACGGACCTGESGYIWVNRSEIEAIAEFVGCSVEVFEREYLMRVRGRYSLIEKQIAPNNYACIFFDLSKRRCGIYPVRPTQCRTFPFWHAFDGEFEALQEECMGVSLLQEKRKL